MNTTETQKHVEASLKPLEPELNQVVHAAWQKYRTTPAELRVHLPRTRANVVWEYMTDEAERVLASNPRVRIVSQSLTKWFLVDDYVTVRFKKGDVRGYTNNVATQQALLYHDPNPEPVQGLLFPSTVRVDVVYVLDPTETEIADILVVARDRNRIAWDYSIYRPAASVTDLARGQEPQPAQARLRAKLEQGKQSSQ